VCRPLCFRKRTLSWSRSGTAFVTQPEQDFWLRGLFWSIGSIDETTLGVVNQLLDRGDTASVRIALQLIEGAPPALALTRPDFAVQALSQNCTTVRRAKPA
jgi:hypothetical protein